MDPVERKAFLYCQAEFNGASVNWRNGEITPKPTPRA